MLISRILYLQINHAAWEKIGMEERVFFQRVVADRGNILAEDGTILATSVPYYRVAIDPMLIDTTQFPAFDDSLKVLSYQLFDLIGRKEAVKDTTIDSLFYYKRIRTALAKKDRHLYVSKKILNYKEFNLIKTFPILNRKRKEGGGMIVEKLNNKRFYPYGEMAQATLGIVSQDTAGVRGIEFSYNKILRGKDGYFLAQKVAGGSYVPLTEYGDADADDGYDIVTTLDVDLQDIVEKAVENGVIISQAKSGTAILMETATGKIKAIANYPEVYNYGIAGLIEPGSTFKLASVLAALEEHVIDLKDTVDTGDGKLTLGDKEITDSHPYGKLTYEGVLAKSSNVGIAKVTMQGFNHQPKKFIEYLERFGFNEPANKQMKGEPSPKMNRPGDAMWSGSALPSMSIGYSIQVTPLQVLTFYNAIANGGKRIKPYLVSHIRDNSTLIENLTPALEEKQICSFVNAEKAKKMLKAVVAYGTADNINDTEFVIAGKTGTARKIVNGQYVARYRASFVGFFPADKPLYTCYVMVDEPGVGSFYGADVAAPIFKSIATQVYNLNQKVTDKLVKISPEPITTPAAKIMRRETAEKLYPKLEVETSNIPKEGEWLATRNSKHQINFRQFKAAGRMPDVRGMSARDALSLLEQMNLKVRVSGIGRVTRQSLAPGTKIGGGGYVTIFLD